MVNPPHLNRPPTFPRGRLSKSLAPAAYDSQWSGYFASIDSRKSRTTEEAPAAPAPNLYDAVTLPAQDTLPGVRSSPFSQRVPLSQ